MEDGLTRHNLQLQQQTTVFDASSLLTNILRTLRSATRTTVAATIAAAVIPTVHRLRARCPSVSHLQTKATSIISTALSSISIQFRQQPHTVPVATKLGGTSTAITTPDTSSPHDMTFDNQPLAVSSSQSSSTSSVSVSTNAMNENTMITINTYPDTRNDTPMIDGNGQPPSTMATLAMRTSRSYAGCERSYAGCDPTMATLAMSNSRSYAGCDPTMATLAIGNSRSYAGCERSYAGCDLSTLTTTSTPSSERTVLQHTQPVQLDPEPEQSAVSLSEPARPTSSSSILATSLLASSRLEIGSTVPGFCGFSELLFGTAGPSPDCNHDYIIDNHDYMIAHLDCITAAPTFEVPGS
jgi:hypothetical protein